VKLAGLTSGGCWTAEIAKGQTKRHQKQAIEIRSRFIRRTSLRLRGSSRAADHGGRGVLMEIRRRFRRGLRRQTGRLNVR